MTGMTGRLRLVVGLDGSGRCALLEHYCSQLHRVLQIAPGEVPAEGIVYVLNPTGGVLQGDRLDAEIRVDSGAHAIVTTPSATKIHRSDEFPAESRTRLTVAAGGLLEYVPEPLIPFAGSRFVEDLTIDVAAGGKVLAWEILAPGRTAKGERFAYDLLGLRLRVTEADRVVLRERAELRPREEPFGSLVLGDASYYGVLLVLGADPSIVVTLARESCGETRAGVSRLPGTGVIVKALAAEGHEIEALFRRIRERVAPELSGRPATPLRTV